MQLSEMSRHFFIAALLGAGLTARAQEPQLRLFEGFHPPAALQLPAADIETNDTGAASDDLGRQVFLVRRPTPRPFQVSSETEYLYDSNILLLDNNRVADSLLSETVTASYPPKLVDRLQSSLYAKYQIIRYADNTQLDFEANAVGLSLSRPVQEPFTVYGSAEAVRLYLTNGNDEFFKMFDLTAGLWRGQTVGQSGWLFYGYGLGFFGRFQTATAALIGIAFFSLQIAFSTAWLDRFEYGPIEWLWRSLTYAAIQPIRRRT